MDMRESGITNKKSSFMSCEITLYQFNNYLLTTDILKNEYKLTKLIWFKCCLKIWATIIELCNSLYSFKFNKMYIIKINIPVKTPEINLKKEDAHRMLRKDKDKKDLFRIHVKIIARPPAQQQPPPPPIFHRASAASEPPTPSLMNIPAKTTYSTGVLMPMVSRH